MELPFIRQVVVNMLCIDMESTIERLIINNIIKFALSSDCSAGEVNI